MDEELHALVAAHVVVRILVDGACVLRGEVGDLHGECLLVLLAELWLTGVSHAGDSRRQDVVHGFAVAILFNVDGGDVERTINGGRGARIG